MHSWAQRAHVPAYSAVSDESFPPCHPDAQERTLRDLPPVVVFNILDWVEMRVLDVAPSLDPCRFFGMFHDDPDRTIHLVFRSLLVCAPALGSRRVRQAQALKLHRSLPWSLVRHVRLWSCPVLPNPSAPFETVDTISSALGRSSLLLIRTFFFPLLASHARSCLRSFVVNDANFSNAMLQELYHFGKNSLETLCISNSTGITYSSLSKYLPLFPHLRRVALLRNQKILNGSLDFSSIFSGACPLSSFCSDVKMWPRNWSAVRGCRETLEKLRLFRSEVPNQLFRGVETLHVLSEVRLTNCVLGDDYYRLFSLDSLRGCFLRDCSLKKSQPGASPIQRVGWVDDDNRMLRRLDLSGWVGVGDELGPLVRRLRRLRQLWLCRCGLSAVHVSRLIRDVPTKKRLAVLEELHLSDNGQVLVNLDSLRAAADLKGITIVANCTILE